MTGSMAWAGRRAVVDTALREGKASIRLYWVPLGAGGHSVRLNGRVFEAASAIHERRHRRDLYHSALEVLTPGGRFVIEVAPVPREAARYGVVSQGAVGSRRLQGFRWMRYGLRCWRDGVIPDRAEAVKGPRELDRDARRAELLLALVPSVPMHVWGRDETGAGEMWTSNSVISWLLTSSGFRTELLDPPAGGRAPGWRAGIAAARDSTVQGACASKSMSAASEDPSPLISR